jgi:hypothetical protein
MRAEFAGIRHLEISVDRAEAVGVGDNVAALAFQRRLRRGAATKADMFIDLHGIGAGECWRKMSVCAGHRLFVDVF